MSYADLSVQICDRKILLEKIGLAIKLGYEVIAVDIVHTPSKNVMKKKKKQKDQAGDGVMKACTLKLTDEELKSLQVDTKRVKILSRVTLNVSDSDQLQYLMSPEVQEYDIVAVRPTSSEIFAKAAKYVNLDIIQLEMEKNTKVITPGGLSEGIQKGIHFEIQYGPAIRDSSVKRYLISNSQLLASFSKSKNIIISSGAERAIELRGPHDVANLGLLFGLNEAQAKNSVSRSCRSVLLHAEERRALKAAVALSMGDLPEDQKWVKDKLHEIHSLETTEESSPKKRKLE
ncbi:ribonuclease P protein subunit p30-like [Saccostrea echinata]|uniref:ribonuclease P protein subunit p30-like n=1 Tax=Saccostrea echinata TaxID=191078 RepID=UPI002A840F2F|nr:ribonuclease P protein subunit p30-like [Saccostrea echinata]